MDDNIKQARRERETCEDYLRANPSTHYCSILKPPVNLPTKPEMVYNNLLTGSQLLTEATP